MPTHVPPAAAWQLQSAVPGVHWPALPSPDARAALALLFQFEQAQWLAPAELREHQLGQLAPLLRHAYEHSPFHRDRWRARYDPRAPLTWDGFRRLPLLTRRELGREYPRIVCRALPARQDAAGELKTSGSTGSPVTVRRTRFERLLWNAITLREHLWHRRDLGARLAAIRIAAKPGIASSWGTATEGLVHTGQASLLDVSGSTDEQLDWLVAQRAVYLITYPSLVDQLARAARRRGIVLPELREVRTFGESLGPGTRDLCRQAWNAGVVDIYSAVETGYLALQCPQSETYHVQSEAVLVEILNDAGRACGPGETGRVVVTALHGYATPLIRYEIGDYAEVGAPCGCGRGLPVLTRILGRSRNLFVTSTGARYWPALKMGDMLDIAPIEQAQIVQRDYDHVEARLVVGRALSKQEESALRGLLQPRLPPNTRVTFAYPEVIPRGPGGKYEDLVSEVAPPEDHD